MTKEQDKQRIEHLREQIHRHDALYYVEAKPEISDREYDLLMAELRELEAKHPELVTPDSPTQRVGGEPIEGFATVEHELPMLSIDNTYNEEQVREFDQRVRKALGTAKYCYLVDPKIDGVACSLRYEGGRLALAATRGDGQFGDDITANARVIRSIPLRLAGDDWPAVVEVRGEIYWPRKAFAAYNAKRREQGLETFANPRNGAAGTIKQLDPKVVAQRGLAFIVHGFGIISDIGVPPVSEVQQQKQRNSEDRGETPLAHTGKMPVPREDAGGTPATHADKMSAGHAGRMPATHAQINAKFKQWGLPVSPYAKVCGNIDQVLGVIKEWATQRVQAEYETDGMVVKIDQLALREELGTTSKFPRWAIAYKYQAEQAATVLRSVLHSVGRLGTVTPVAQFDEVHISGTNVVQASLHNYDQVERLDVRVGDTVVVEKAGEIIPQVVQVVFGKRPEDAKAIHPPSHCPACDGPTERDEGGVYLRCINPECPAQIRQRLEFYAGRDQMDIENLGPAIVDQLVTRGLVHHFADLYKLDLLTLSGLERMGTKSATKLLEAIEASKSRGCERLLAGLGIRHVGGRASTVLCGHFGDIDAIATAPLEELSNVHEIGPVIAQSVFDFFHSDAGRDTIRRLEEVGVKITASAAPRKEAGGALAGKTVVVTGSLQQFSRSQAEKAIADAGGRATSSVSKSTSFVVVGADAGSKLDKARALGVEVIDEQEFIKRLKEE